MINNESNKPEHLQPEDSERKAIRHPENDEETVVKPKDKQYSKDSPDFGNVAAKKEGSDQREG